MVFLPLFSSSRRPRRVLLSSCTTTCRTKAIVPIRAPGRSSAMARLKADLRLTIAFYRDYTTKPLGRERQFHEGADAPATADLFAFLMASIGCLGDCSKQLRQGAARHHGPTPAGCPCRGGYMVTTFFGRRRSGNYYPPSGHSRLDIYYRALHSPSELPSA